MAGRRIEIEVPDELAENLDLVAQALGIPTVEETALIAVAEWVSRRKAELDDRDPDQKYFVNEALDELENKK
ncbi:MAG TPA: hypothetical protein VMA09_10510 [Candidatus Binataceae bacterium]|nr:hypothetical protein [Candidatus Binataceae bacterium]